MNSIGKTLKNETSEYVAIGLMVAFIISDVKVPKVLANMIDTIVGRVLVIGVALMLLFAHGALGVVSLVFAYTLIRRSERSTGTYHMKRYLPSLEKKSNHFTAMNQFPVTLEEQMVNKMVPVVSGPLSSSKFKPVMDTIHQAAKL